jgi:hypothetical protein
MITVRSQRSGRRSPAAAASTGRPGTPAPAGPAHRSRPAAVAVPHAARQPPTGHRQSREPRSCCRRPHRRHMTRRGPGLPPRGIPGPSPPLPGKGDRAAETPRPRQRPPPTKGRPLLAQRGPWPLRPRARRRRLSQVSRAAGWRAVEGIPSGTQPPGLWQGSADISDDGCRTHPARLKACRRGGTGRGRSGKRRTGQAPGGSARSNRAGSGGGHSGGRARAGAAGGIARVAHEESSTGRLRPRAVRRLRLGPLS